ncbi:F-box domain-containing protein [Chloropicon primus]|uniref:F-box domain-containing protein n=1 Tax=Chloropicon primus TaxID=1764295 RepID=A0A5B8MIR3_9CHLO|nr:hypothetical protein A3770_03p20730 [Chloropicon primus]UPQ98767.1 F-box domain-containing protein [Chloropicon primus]|eukprot:QDZ19555.1 hypothetical protein A3770_03p20730 [Chloropicon primus]
MKLRSGMWLDERDGSQGRLGEDMEVIRCVLERVEDPVDLARCMAVCKSWRNIAIEMHHWMRLCDRLDGGDCILAPLRLILQKHHQTPVDCFVCSSLLAEDAKRKLVTNRLLLLGKESHDFDWGKAGDRCEGGGSPSASAVPQPLRTLSFDDLVFTLDVLVDGKVRSSICFERAHANTTNKLLVNLPVGEMMEDDMICGGGGSTASIHKSVTQRGLHLLNLIQGTIEVKVSIMRRTDMKMTQVFSYNTHLDNKFNWDLSWDVAGEDERLSDQNPDAPRGQFRDFLDEWVIWLYSNHCCSCSNPENSFHVKNRAIFDEEDGTDVLALVPEFDTSGDEAEEAGGVDTMDCSSGCEADTDAPGSNHFVLCDVRLKLCLSRTESGFGISITDALVMEFYHYWDHKGKTFYVELKDTEFLECLQHERGWN